MANLDDAARAYRAAVAAVEAVVAAGRPARSRNLAHLRKVLIGHFAALDEAMIEAAQDGVKQTEIIKVSGYSREHVRTILRAGGVESDR